MSADRPGEFETIARLFRPLAAGDPAARGLKDDAAVIPVKAGHDLVVTKDALVAGVHFLPNDPMDLIARKALRVNLSDLAAKGAEPFGYFLAVAWTREMDWEDRSTFARGLGEDQKLFGVHLLGGDTVMTPGPFSVSVTAMGWVPHDRSPSRGGARAGDAVVVSGSIGDGWLGLQAAKGALHGLEPARIEALRRRYHLPEPRLDLARAVRDHVGASIDISDGLVADLSHIAEASGARIELDLERVPLSGAAKAWLGQRADELSSRLDLATGGDDYEIACTVRPEHLDAYVKAATRIGLPAAVIGGVVAGQGIAVRFEGEDVPVPQAGWSHD
jgi:thiamine-monophosphate kinase